MEYPVRVNYAKNVTLLKNLKKGNKIKITYENGTNEVFYVNSNFENDQIEIQDSKCRVRTFNQDDIWKEKHGTNVELIEVLPNDDAGVKSRCTIMGGRGRRTHSSRKRKTNKKRKHRKTRR